MRGEMAIFKQPLPGTLDIDEFTVNPRLAKLIPANLALQFHSLPIAESEGQLTIVMADPEDQAGQVQIRKFINQPMHILRGDVRVIDSLIAEVWPEYACRELHLAILLLGRSDSSIIAYGINLAKNLLADEVHIEIMRKGMRAASLNSKSDYDLVIIGDTHVGSLRERARITGTRGRLLCTKKSILLVRNPLWPIERILCILRGHESDLDTVRWVTRLTQLCHSQVEVLVTAPQAPLMYAGLPGMQVSLDEMLRANTLHGGYLRRALDYLANWAINPTLRILHGFSPMQMEADIRPLEADLVAISSSETPLWRRINPDDLLDRLIRCGESSLLIAR